MRHNLYCISEINKKSESTKYMYIIIIYIYNKKICNLVICDQNLDSLKFLKLQLHIL